MTLTDGVIHAGTLFLVSGGSFDFAGGTLHVDDFNGNLVNEGGTLAPGHSLGTTAVSGHYTQQAAAELEIEIRDIFPGQWDYVTVEGNASLEMARSRLGWSTDFSLCSEMRLPS